MVEGTKTHSEDDPLTVCFVIGTIVFILSAPLALFALVGYMFKHIGVTYMNRFSTVFLAVLPFLFYAAQLAIYDQTQYAWGIAVLPLLLGLFSLFYCYVLCSGAVILGRRYVYRLGYFMEPHRYAYCEVKNCIGKSDSGWVRRRSGRKLVTHYEVVVTFRDKTEGSFGVKDKNSKKAQYFYSLLKKQKAQP